MKKQKGIIISPGQIISLGDGSVRFMELESSEISFLLLYWDKVVIVNNNYLHMEVPRERTLRELKAVDFVRVGFNEEDFHSKQGWANEQLFIKSQYKAAERIFEEDSLNTDWSLNQISNTQDLILPEIYTRQAPLLKMDFMQLLPSPGNLTPYEEILEFKEKRRDILTALHVHVNSICEEIIQSPDVAKERTRAIIDFENSINDLHKVSIESFGITKKKETSLYLNITPTSIKSALGSFTALDNLSHSGLHPLTILGVAAASFIKIDFKYGISFKSKDNLTYIKQASNRNLFKRQL